MMPLPGPHAILLFLRRHEMQQIPWSDEAVAVQQLVPGHPGERVIIAQGTLGSVVDKLTGMAGELTPTLLISLSDRRVPPFQLDLCEIRRLIGIRRRRRPERSERGPATMGVGQDQNAGSTI